MPQRNRWLVWWGLGILAGALVLWSGYARQSAAASRGPEEKTFRLKPDIIFVKAAFLTGALQDLHIAERVDRATGKILDAPVLRGTLRLQNDSTDQAAHLLGGRIEFRDAAGRLIPLPKDRGTDTFTFIPVPSDRLDPGRQVSQVIEVPFPGGAIAASGLREVGVELTFLPVPYREYTVSIPVHLGG